MKPFVKNSPNKEILFKKVLKSLKSEKFCIIKDFHKLSTHKQIINILKKKFDYRKDVRITGQRRIKQNDYQRLDIGNSYKNPRFIRTIYVNERQKTNNRFFKLIEPIINLRNYVSKIKKFNKIYPSAKSISNTLNHKKYLFCDFVRMIQYPTGGGFLAEHDDHDKYYCKGVYQALLPLTVKKIKGKKRNLATYEDGGLFLNLKKKKIFVDDYMKAGDLLLFDPKISHGINSVDPMKKMNMSKWNGRLTLAFSISNFLT